jgi:hypothetical protein
MLRAVNSTAPPAPGPESAKAPPVLDEDRLDAPSRQTLWLLGLMCAATLVMWAMGRLACNYHVPGESLTPRALTPEDRSRTAKDAAMEFARAIEAGDFATAALVSEGSAKAKLGELEKQCPDCAQRKQTARSLVVVGTALADNGKEGYVRVVTDRGARGQRTGLYHTVRGAKSFVVAEILEPNAPIPKLAAPEPPPGFHATPGSPSVPPLLRRPPENSGPTLTVKPIMAPGHAPPGGPSPNAPSHATP